MMRQALQNGYKEKVSGSNGRARKYFREALSWSQKIINDPVWLNLARRDNTLKEEKFGGIIAYEWGTVYPENKHYIHTEILRYPLLNEVGLAMWALSAANFELGNYTETKWWMKRIIKEVPLHKIADIVGGFEERERSEI